MPEINDFNINEEVPLAIFLTSDGIQGKTTNNEVKDIINCFAYSKNINNCVKTIVEKDSEKLDDSSKE